MLNGIQGLIVTATSFVKRHLAMSVISTVLFACLLIAPMVYFVEQGYPGSSIDGIGTALWWAVVTLLTVGYGDVVPVSPMGQTLAVVLMTVGVTSVGILTARISTYFLEEALRNRRGYVDEKLLNDHIVICGWKFDMAGFLYKILESNPGLGVENLVVVTSVSDEELDSLLTDSSLRKLRIVRGEFYSETTLNRAAPERARKVMILADNSPTNDGKRPTSTEADARTVMAAMTISKISKDVPVVAEVIDRKMDQYLRLANVNEIIYSRDYSRLVMARASSGIGIPNIVHELLDSESMYTLRTQEIPNEFVDKTYGDLCKKMQFSDSNITIIGVLENSGNSHQIKSRELRKAQQTSDVGQLVSNLKKVKSLQFNKPVLTPRESLKISEGMMAIVIEIDPEKERSEYAA